jgi:hypothetical protein
VRRFELAYGPISRWLLPVFMMGPRTSWVEVRPSELYVRMGFAFRATIPRSAITAIERAGRPLSIGVHGWRGRWMVNGSRRGIVKITIEPAASGSFNGIPLHLREVRIGLADPDAFLAALP